MRTLILATALLLTSCTSPTAPEGDYQCDAVVYAEDWDAIPDSIAFYNCRGEEE